MPNVQRTRKSRPMPSDHANPPHPDAAPGDSSNSRRVPIGSLLGLLGAGFLAIAVLCSQRTNRPPPLVGVPQPDAPTATATASQTATLARLYYLVSDRAQAQELAEAFTRGAEGGDILLAGT